MNPSKPYTEIELWGFLHSIVSGLVWIRDKYQQCKNISSSTIYINHEGNYQICELGIIKESSLFEEIIY